MKKHFFYIFATLSFFIFLSKNLFSQQLPIFTQYREYHSYINPANLSPDYIMQEYNLSLGASYRIQWVGIEDAPRSLFFKADYIHRTKAAFDLSFGGYLLGMNTDPIRWNGAYGKVAALFTKDPYYGAFSVGFTFGALQYQVGIDNLNPFHVNDVIIQNNNQQQMIPDLGVGLFYYKQFADGMWEGDMIYGGLSMPQLLGLNLKFQDETGNFSIQQLRHIYGVAGFYKYFNEQSFIEPSVWFKYAPNAPMQFDMNIRYQHQQLFWVGTGMSSSKILHFEGGVYFNSGKDKNRIKLGYGFDYSLAKYGNVFGTAHEINLAFLMDTRKIDKKN